MKKMFDAWIEGINSIRQENEKKYLAASFNRNRLLALGWRAWARYME